MQDKRKANAKFNRACLDIGAQKTCVGLNQAKAYFLSNGGRMKLVASAVSLRFGKDVQKSLGITQIQIPTPDQSYIVTNLEVVSATSPRNRHPRSRRDNGR